MFLSIDKIREEFEKLNYATLEASSTFDYWKKEMERMKKERLKQYRKNLFFVPVFLRRKKKKNFSWKRFINYVITRWR